MERVQIRTLIPGRKLGAPLYDRRQRLLLAEDVVLTSGMLQRLLASGVQQAYLGPWDETEFERLDSAPEEIRGRSKATRWAAVLEEEMEKCVDTAPLDVSPGETSLASLADDSVQASRSADRISAWEAGRQQCEELVGAVISGSAAGSRGARLVVEAVNMLMRNFLTDRSLLNNQMLSGHHASYLARHATNVAVLSINIAAAMGYDEDQVREVGQAALLQDLGMARVPEEIRGAPRKLTAAEVEEMRRHTVHVLDIMESLGMSVSRTCRLTVYQTHERIDGSGYPHRRRKRTTHRYAQIVAVADVYDAMTSDRSWRKAYHPFRVMEHLIREAGRQRFDTAAVRGLLRYLSLFPLGSIVKLTSGEVAKVVHSTGQHFDSPVVSVLFDADGVPCATPQLVDLVAEERLRVAHVIEDDVNVNLYDGF